jgi:nucleotide-binding universal stress UspA family protein
MGDVNQQTTGTHQPRTRNRGRAAPVVTSQRIGKAILEHTSRLNASLFVMGAYGQPALREFFLGSVTRTLLEEASVPLFLSQ